MKTSQPCGSRGRPRAFDPDEALDCAMHVFWTKGYEGASLADLAAAMGMNRPSIYGAFGNKEELFKKAFARYSQGPGRRVQAAMELPRLRDAIEALLYGAADALPCSEHPGCLSVVGALTSGDGCESVRAELTASRNASLNAWTERIERAQREENWPSDPPAEALARYIMTVAVGMSVQASSGATCEDLRRTVAIALNALPPSENS